LTDHDPTCLRAQLAGSSSRRPSDVADCESATWVTIRFTQPRGPLILDQPAAMETRNEDLCFPRCAAKLRCSSSRSWPAAGPRTGPRFASSPSRSPWFARVAGRHRRGCGNRSETSDSLRRIELFPAPARGRVREVRNVECRQLFATPRVECGGTPIHRCRVDSHRATGKPNYRLNRLPPRSSVRKTSSYS